MLGAGRKWDFPASLRVTIRCILGGRITCDLWVSVYRFKHSTNPEIINKRIPWHFAICFNEFRNPQRTHTRGRHHEDLMWLIFIAGRWPQRLTAKRQSLLRWMKNFDRRISGLSTQPSSVATMMWNITMGQPSHLYWAIVEAVSRFLQAKVTPVLFSCRC